MVIGNPAFMNCQRETSTPILFPVSTTMTLAAAPRIVAFPASVELVTNANQRLLLPMPATKGESNMTAGTLLIRLERMAQNPVSPGMLVSPKQLLDWNAFIISARRPEVSTPLSTTKRPTKNDKQRPVDLAQHLYRLNRAVEEGKEHEDERPTDESHHGQWQVDVRRENEPDEHQRQRTQDKVDGAVHRLGGRSP